MTRFVTALDALVLSPCTAPERPEQLPDIVDGFDRVAARMETGRVEHDWTDEGVVVFDPADHDLAFRLTAVLKDGFVYGPHVPASWCSRISLDMVAAALDPVFRFADRPRGWGAHVPIVLCRDVNGGVETLSRLPGRLPLIDPLRDSARLDDASVIPVAVEATGQWAALCLPWEHLDRFLAGGRPGEAWLRRRTRTMLMPSGRWWWELEGLRDAGDSRRYAGMWTEPRRGIACLGWPAYFFLAASPLHRCRACGGPTIAGRQYCGTPDCNTDRAAARQRAARAALSQRDNQG